MTVQSYQPDRCQSFACQVCGYVYSESAGTRFDELDNWHCPLCHADQSAFVLLDNAGVVNTEQNPCSVVIVGAGLAGWSVVEALQALDKQVAITLISADGADRYHKPMLSVAISQNKGRTELVRATGTQTATDLGIRLLAHTEVFAIDTEHSSVKTSQGDVMYDKLVLAIGATPIYPPNIDSAYTSHINHLDDFAQLQQRLSTGNQRIAIIGAGMVGVEFAEDLIKAGHQVSLLDRHAYPLAKLLPEQAGEQVLLALQNLGVAWLGGVHIDGVDSQRTITFSQNGTQHNLAFDEVVMATGLALDERLPVSAGLSFDKYRGITVNPKTLQTSQKNIYALGDCVSIDGVPCRYVAVHRPQATAIAHHILGVPYAGYAHQAPMIRLKNKSITVSANGNPCGDGHWQLISDDGTQQAGIHQTLHQLSNGKVVAKLTIKTNA